MLYTKSTFEEIGGYNNTLKIASGDDVFLLEKFSGRPGESIQFAKSESAIVKTKQPENFKAFIQQRVRWAKKTQYTGNTKKSSTLMGLTLFYLILVVCLVALIFTRPSVFIWAFLWVVVGKVLIDLYFFKSVLPFYKKSSLLPFVVFVDFLHPFYMIIIAALSLIQPVRWKNRTHRNG